MDKRVIAGIGLLLVVLFLAPSLLTSGYLGGGVINSVSETTLNGRPAYLINMLQYTGGADTLISTTGNDSAGPAALSFPWLANSPTDREISIIQAKGGNRYTYTATERTGTSKAIQYYTQKYMSYYLDFNSFSQACGAGNLAFNVGNVVPEFYCYEPRTEWLVSDFDRRAGATEPYVDIIIDIWKNGQLQGQSAVSLSKLTTEGVLVDDNGIELGKASMVGMAPTFLTAPDGSGVKMISNPSTSSVNVVDGAIDSEVRDIKDTFITCQLQAQRQVGQTQSLTFMGLVFSTTGSYDKDKINACISNLRTRVQSLNSLAPTGDYRASLGADYSTLATTNTFSIVNKYSIPVVNLWLYKDQVGSVGVQQNLANPSSVSCQNVQIAGGDTGLVPITIQNGNTQGTLYYSLNCASPVSVPVPSGSVAMAAGESKTFNVQISTGRVAATSSCTITANSTDLKNSVSNACSITQTNVCALTPRPGFYIRTNPLTQKCEEYCPLTAANCAADQTFNAATCTCSGGTTPPPPPPPGNATACLPIIQKSAITSWTGGILGIGATPVYGCVLDLMGVGEIILAGAGFLFFIKKKKEAAKQTGIVGIAFIALSFMADNALVLALGGAGLLLGAAVLAGLYIAFKVLV